jgi:hypothetical protein
MGSGQQQYYSLFYPHLNITAMLVLAGVLRCTTNCAIIGPLSTLTGMMMFVSTSANETVAHRFQIARIGVGVCSSAWPSSVAKDTSMSSLEVGERRHGISSCSSVLSLIVASHAVAAMSTRKGEAE